jgi:hypothetical protein
MGRWEVIDHRGPVGSSVTTTIIINRPAVVDTHDTPSPGLLGLR